MSRDKTFSIDKSFYQPIKGLSDEMLGKLFRAIFEYQINDTIDCDADIAMPFRFFYSKFEQDATKRAEIKRINAQNGSKGGLAKKRNEMVKKSTDRQSQKQPSYCESVNLIYDAYPSKCPVKGSNTGKCEKNKAQIEKLLQIHSETNLIKTIQSYVADCKQSNTYIKNYSTFLNNLPDMNCSQDAKNQEDNRKLKWHIRPTGKTRESTKEQFELDKERFGEENIDFLGFAS